MDASRDTTQNLFFPPLKRRAKYSVRTDGKYHSYAYYRKYYQGEIAEDCSCRCVYCDSHENEVGGREQMQLDHFRPYTLKGFEHLEDNPNNFHHACGRCNLLKSDKWPSSHPTNSHDGVVGFVDPFVDNRRLYFSVENDGQLIPLQPPAQYLIRVLALNRPHLKLLRQRRIYQMQLRNFIENNLPYWENAAQGKVEMSEEAFKDIARSALEIKRLYDLCSFA